MVITSTSSVAVERLFKSLPIFSSVTLASRGRHRSQHNCQFASWRRSASFTVGKLGEGAEQAPKRLDTCISSKDVHASRQQIQNSIKAGLVYVNGARVCKASHTTRPGDSISYELLQSIPSEVRPEAISLDVVYRDDDVVVVNKPAGMVVHPSAGHWTGTLVNALMHYLDLPIWDLQSHPAAPTSFSGLRAAGVVASQQEVPHSLQDGIMRDEQQDESSSTLSVFRPGIVHRLDIGTSGLMVVALNDAALRHLSQQFKERTVNRVYLSILVGCPSTTSGRISTNIGRNPKDRKTMTWFGHLSTKGRPSSSSYQVVESLGDRASLVAWKLHSGRTHQIRVHAKYMGHPVFCDDAYGKPIGSPLERQGESPEHWAKILDISAEMNRPALHAASIGFMHPTSHKRMQFEANLPADLTLCLSSLRTLES